MGSINKLSRITGHLTQALAVALCFSAGTVSGAYIEFTNSRDDVGFTNLIPSILPGTTTIQLTPASDTIGSFFSNGFGFGDGFGGVYEIRARHVAPNGIILFSGFSEILFGSGIYLNATGQTAFAGFFDPVNDREARAEYGYINAPGLSGPDLTFISSFNDPGAVSPLMDGKMYNASGSRTNVPYSDVDPVRVIFPSTMTDPFVTTVSTADNVGNFRSTGPNGESIQGRYQVPFVDNSVPGRSIFSGFTNTTGGGGSGWLVDGGYGVFAGRGRYVVGEPRGTEDVSDFGYFTARRTVAEPSVALLLLGVSLAGAATRRRMPISVARCGDTSVSDHN